MIAQASTVRRVSQGLGLVIVLGIATAGIRWAGQDMGAERGPLQELKQDRHITLVESSGAYVLARKAAQGSKEPGGEIKRPVPHIGIIYFPDSRVSPLSYAFKNSEIAAAGVTVFGVSAPLNLPILRSTPADDVISGHPAISEWYVAGHGSGGELACRYAVGHAARLTGLILYGSFCGSDVSGSGLRVLSVTGSSDGVVTPKDVADHRDRLPQAAQTIELQGLNHASFGDYGSQSGDGRAGVDSSAARDLLTRTTMTFLGLPPS